MSEFVQNTEARCIVAGEVVLRPGYPTEIDSLDELVNKYPAIAAKVTAGTIKRLSADEAEKAEEEIDAEIESRTKKDDK